MSVTNSYAPALGTPALPPTATLPPQGAPYAKAPLGMRVLASVIDHLIAFAGLIPFLLLALTSPAEQEAVSTVAVIALLAGMAWMLGYLYLKDGARGGAGFGKQLTGLMVVHLPTGLPCTKARSGYRGLIWFAVGSFPVVGFLAEPLVALCTADGRRLADRFAGTQVIRASDYHVVNYQPLQPAS